jgi:arylsulfatase A-like enzyme
MAGKEIRCIYFMQLDEVRKDHISVYGYHRKQKHIESIAEDGVAFADMISGSSYTGAATPVMHTGMIGPHTGVRDPFHVITAPTLQEYLRKAGFITQGCMSQSVAGSGIGMDRGFDTFIEPTDPNAPDTWGDGVVHWRELGVEVDDRFHAKPVGKRYVDENLEFIKDNKDRKFYLYNQFYETHTGSEQYLVESGRIKEGVYPENSYYDAKIQLADEEVIGSVLEALKKLGLYENALIIITGDHGTTLRRECWPLGDYIYDPVDVGELDNTHSSLYDVDLRIPFIIKAPSFAKEVRGKIISGQVRSIDMAPTILDLVGVTPDQVRPEMDGESLVPCVEQLRGHGKLAYAETVWSAYGMGARQMLREDNWKYIRYLSSMHEEFFDLQKDPREQVNLIDRLRYHAPKWLRQLREEMNDYMRAEPKGIVRPEMREEEKEAIQRRLQRLGYVRE